MANKTVKTVKIVFTGIFFISFPIEKKPINCLNPPNCLTVYLQLTLTLNSKLDPFSFSRILFPVSAYQTSFL